MSQILEHMHLHTSFQLEVFSLIQRAKAEVTLTSMCLTSRPTHVALRLFWHSLTMIFLATLTCWAMFCRMKLLNSPQTLSTASTLPFLHIISRNSVSLTLLLFMEQILWDFKMTLAFVIWL